MSAVLTPPPQSQPPAMTADEFMERYAGERAEFLFGKVVMFPTPFQKHGKICNWVSFYLTQHVVQHDCGHVTSNDSFVRLPTAADPDKVRGADISYFSYERVPKGPFPAGPITAGPDLVFEIKSPSDSWNEVFAKVLEYLDHGVRAVVVLDDATHSASVFRPDVRQEILEATDTLTLSDVLPGFAVPVGKLFE